ncbi:thermonuclease family protein [Bradyrhizobium sp. USDA 4516]
MDAPESSQFCRGEDKSSVSLWRAGGKRPRRLIGRRSVDCIPLSLDPYGRTVGTCSVGGADLGEWLVQWPCTGLASILEGQI